MIIHTKYRYNKYPPKPKADALIYNNWLILLTETSGETIDWKSLY